MNWAHRPRVRGLSKSGSGSTAGSPVPKGTAGERRCKHGFWQGRVQAEFGSYIQSFRCARAAQRDAGP